MFIINSISTDPCYNLAAEEYLLKQFKENVFMLYVNEPSVIVGKHQNTMAEINYKYVRANNIKVVRRISGGGTVYHDLGNLNFAFLYNGKEGKMVDFERYTQPIIEFLNRLTIPARFKEFNNICVNGIKISGNAEHVYKNRVLHHGTLLYDSDLKKLDEVLRVQIEKFTDRAVKSRRSRVINISDLLPKKLTMAEFRELFLAFIRKSNLNVLDYQFNEIDEKAILELQNNKYKTWDWNYGYSPRYKLQNEFLYDGNNILHISINVDKGVIDEIEILQKGTTNYNFSRVEKALLNKLHNEEILREALSEIDFSIHFPGMNKEQFLLECF